MRTLARAALVAVSAALVAVLATLWVCRWHTAHRLKRVAVSYSEKYEDKTIGRKEDYEKVEEDRASYAEEELSTMIARNKNCMVLSHDAEHSDYRVNISVSRFMGDPSTYGEATLSVMRTNGDVVVTEHFYQDKNTDDIAQQPIKRAWDVLCNR
ncbi:MAG: hypothetical protein WAK29_23745 [Terriglobales bacterium]